jgi:hypothetical protein
MEITYLIRKNAAKSYIRKKELGDEMPLWFDKLQ